MMKVLTLSEFKEEVARWRPKRTIRRVQVHHTYRPNHTDWKEAVLSEGGPAAAAMKLQDGMKRFHTQQRGWSDIGQHLSIMPDGLLVTGRSWDRAPAGIAGWNTGSLMFEAVGDLRKGKDWPIPTAQWRSIAGVCAEWLEKVDLEPDDKTVMFHKEGQATECPGDMDKGELLQVIRAAGDTPEAMDQPDIIETLTDWWDDLMGAVR